MLMGIGPCLFTPIKNKAVAFYGLIGARNIKTIKRTGQIISAKSDLRSFLFLLGLVMSLRIQFSCMITGWTKKNMLFLTAFSYFRETHHMAKK